MLTFLFGMPEPDSLIQLPWNKEIVWRAADLYMDGKQVKASPRVMLKEQIKKISQKKLQMKSGVECEFFLMIRRPPRSTLSSSSAASDVYKRQAFNHIFKEYVSICCN